MSEKIFKGERDGDNTTVWVNEKELRAPPLYLRLHGGSRFDWGGNGNHHSSLDLSKAMLTEVIGDEKVTSQMVAAFRYQFIGNLPGGSWTVRCLQVKKWYQNYQLNNL